MIEFGMVHLGFIILYYLTVIFGFWVANRLDYKSLRIITAITMVLVAVLPMLFLGLVLDINPILALPGVN